MESSPKLAAEPFANGEFQQEHIQPVEQNSSTPVEPAQQVQEPAEPSIQQRTSPPPAEQPSQPLQPPPLPQFQKPVQQLAQQQRAPAAIPRALPGSKQAQPDQLVRQFVADIHYFISVPEDRPLHSRFERGTTISLHKNSKGQGRITFEDAGDPYDFNLTGSISLLRPEYNPQQESLVHVELEYGKDLGAGLGNDWMILSEDLKNETVQQYRPFCLDLYFWARTDAVDFLHHVRSLRSEEPAIEDLSISDPAADFAPKEHPDEEELYKVDLHAINCLEDDNGELFRQDGSEMICRVMRNKKSGEVRLLVHSAYDYGHVTLVYTLNRRSFSYQLPEGLFVQVRFMAVEKRVHGTKSGDNRLDWVRDARPIDSPILRFFDHQDAKRFQEILRGETMMFNCILQWVRSSSEAVDGDALALGIDAGNFTSVDNRRLHIWKNDNGFVKMVFHRQFHLMSAYITPGISIEHEAGTAVVRVSGIKCRALECLPVYEPHEPWECSGIVSSLKMRFPSQEAAVLFARTTMKFRENTSTLFPESERRRLPPSPAATPQSSPQVESNPHMRPAPPAGAAPPVAPAATPGAMAPPPPPPRFQNFGNPPVHMQQGNRPPPLQLSYQLPGAQYAPPLQSPPPHMIGHYQNSQPTPLTATFAPGIQTLPPPPQQQQYNHPGMVSYAPPPPQGGYPQQAANPPPPPQQMNGYFTPPTHQVQQMQQPMQPVPLPQQQQPQQPQHAQIPNGMPTPAMQNATSPQQPSPGRQRSPSDAFMHVRQGSFSQPAVAPLPTPPSQHTPIQEGPVELPATSFDEDDEDAGNPALGGNTPIGAPAVTRHATKASRVWKRLR